MRKRKRKVYDDDDGRVIAPMDVDGMPWHNRHAPKKRSGDGEPPEREKLVLEKGDTFKLVLKLYAAMIPVLLLIVGIIGTFIYILTLVL